MITELKGKSAIVTGGGSGIGKAICLALAQAGVRVTVADMRLESATEVAKEIVAGGGEAVAVACNVSDSEQVTQMVTGAAKQWGALDILINNAGAYRVKRLLETTDQDWEIVMKSLAYGTFYCSREAWRIMREQTGGHILQIGSQAAGWPGENEVAYGVAKTAQLKFTLHLDFEFKLENRIRAKEGKPTGAYYTHILCPGAVDTPLNAAVGRVIPQDKMLQPSEVAGMVTEILRHPAQGWQEFAEQAKAQTYRVGEIGMFAQYPQVVRVWRE